MNKYAPKLLGDKPAKVLIVEMILKEDIKEYVVRKRNILSNLNMISSLVWENFRIHYNPPSGYFGFTIIHHNVTRQVQYKEKSARFDGVWLLKRVKENISGIQNNKKNIVQLCEKLI